MPDLSLCIQPESGEESSGGANRLPPTGGWAVFVDVVTLPRDAIDSTVLAQDDRA